jgi:hypothetical protein
LVTAAGFGSQLSLSAASSAQDPFAPIMTRNIFGLQPLTAATATNSASIPPAKITPNGIITLFGKSQVLFKVTSTPLAGQPSPKERSYRLGEGERQDGIEVQQIDVRAALITFNNHGIVQELGLTIGSASVAAPGTAAVGFSHLPLVTAAARRHAVNTGLPVNQEEYNVDPGTVPNPNDFVRPNGNSLETDPAALAHNQAVSTINGGAGNTYSPSPSFGQSATGGGDAPDGVDSPIIPPGTTR